MKVLSFNFTDTRGGAAIAARRIHHAVREEGVDSQMVVYRKFSNDDTVIGPSNRLVLLYRIGRQKMGQLLGIFFRKKNPQVFHSLSQLPTNWSGWINRSDADLVHLHWINLEFMSIEDIGKITKPVVWTLHDMWAFCGAEHLSYDEDYVEGYAGVHDKPTRLDRWVWNRKKHSWLRPFQIVTPSKWLAGCAQKSLLMRQWPVTTIPNPIDTKLWQLLNREEEKKKEGINPAEKIILFSTSEHLFIPHKGFDLLLDALTKVQERTPVSFTLMVIGCSAPSTPVEATFPIIYKGFVNGQPAMNHLMGLSDIVVVPSRQESLSFVAMEAVASGRPVVAFGNAGITDVVQHNVSGYLAQAYDTEEMAAGILQLIENDALATQMGAHGRKYATENFDASIVARRYIALYKKTINEYNNQH